MTQVTPADVYQVLPGLDGSGRVVMVVPTMVANELAPMVRLAVEQRRGHLKPEALHALDSVACAFEVIAMRHRAEALPQPESDGGKSHPSEVSRAHADLGDASSSEVARVLGVSERQVRYFATSGRLPGRRPGGRWMFRMADVHEFKRKRDAA